MAGQTKRRRPSPALVGLFAVGGIAVWLLGLGRRRRTKGRKPKVASDVELGEAEFPPSKQGQQWDRLRRLAESAEQHTQIRGLASFLLATAKGESAGVPSAMNTTADGPPAFRLFCRDTNYGGRYLNNPWRAAICESSDQLAPRWSFAGGWFQMRPATALATSDKRGHKHDPARVFDPPFAVAYATDLVRRLVVGYGAKTWGDIRAGWALPKWARPDSTADGKAKSIERFEERLRQVASMGADPQLASKAVSTRNYPGFTSLLHALLTAEGRMGGRA